MAHLIKLTDFNAEQVTALADIKEELAATVSAEKAQDKFFELQQEMARLSFEFPDSLEDAAGAVGVEVKTSDWLARFGNEAPFSNPKVLDMAFSDIIIHEQINSDIIEVSDNLALVIRLNEHQATTIKPLTEVSAEIEKTLISEKASEKASVVADELLTKLKAGEDISAQLTTYQSEFSPKADVARAGSDVDPSIVREAFTLPHPSDKEVSATRVNLNNGDLAIVQVQAIKSGSDVPAPGFAEQQAQQLAQMAYQSYLESLKIEAKITRNQRALNASQM